MNYVVLVGRILYVAIFVMAVPGHFTAGTIGYAASKGVPLASIAVPLAGLIALAGALSIVLGYKAKLGAWLIVIFLVPVTLMIHNFWAMTDPNAEQMQQIMFMKNISMLGAALMIAHFGSGPLSLDDRKKS
jgi:putative oxidoreductase